jgi:aryl-alcohol dehydrogenase-like predicted oxidoreductase
MALVEIIKTIAAEKNATPAQISLTWLLAQRDYIVPIPGTTNPGRLEENIGSANIKLSKDDLQKIKDAVSKIDIIGDRYPEALQKMVKN